MALRQEIIKAAAVTVLALLSASGVSVLPAASITALALVQVAGLLNALLALPSKMTIKCDSPVDTASGPAPNIAAGCAAGLVLALATARLLRFLGLCDSLLQVALLACLAGAACCGMAIFVWSSGCSQECHSEQSRVGARCPYDVAFWPRLEEEKEGTERELLLERLVEEYYGPCSVLADASEQTVHVEHELVFEDLVEEYDEPCDVAVDGSVLEAEG